VTNKAAHTADVNVSVGQQEERCELKKGSDATMTGGSGRTVVDAAHASAADNEDICQL
jgi:hypothetical protein